MRSVTFDDGSHFPGRQAMNNSIPTFARHAIGFVVGAAMAVSTGAALAQSKGGAKPLQGQVAKLAWIDPLSGLLGPVGNNILNSWKFAVDKFNASNPAGVKFELISFDNKLSAAETLNAFKSA
ncbi:MAG: hypothetical protein ABI330_12310, partial [Caldimonas sp.]